MTTLARPARLSPSPSTFVFLALLVAASIVPNFTPSYVNGLLTEILIFSLFAISLDLLFGYVGLFAFGHAAFFGVSAYTVAVLAVKFGINVFGGMVLGIVLSTVFALGVGAVCVRTRGFTFLMLTMAFAQLAYSAVSRLRNLTGGSDGIGGALKPTVLGLSFTNHVVMFYFVLAVFVVSFIALRRLVNSAAGHVFVGIRENEQRMQALGFDTQSYKLLAFTISGFFAGVSGALYAVFNSFVSPDMLGWGMSANAIVMIVLGGMGTLIGPILGAAIFLTLQNIVSSYSDHWVLIMGLVLLACALYLRSGLYGLVPKRWRL